MTYTATILVASNDHEATTRAVREAYTSLGAIELDSAAPRTNTTRTVVVSHARDGFIAVTDDTWFTADLAVAERVATALSTGVAVIAVRGGGSYGKSAARTFGAWKGKLPASGKPNKLYKALDGILAHDALLVDAWEQLDAPGTKLAFDLSRAQLSPGPFANETPAELADVEREAMRSIASDVMSTARNNGLEAGLRQTRALRSLFGWQVAYDDVCNTLYCRVCPTEIDMATLAWVTAQRALAGLRSGDTQWEVEDTPAFWRAMRWATAVAAGAVVGERAEFDALMSRVDDADRAEIAKMLWDRYEEPLCELCSKERFDAVVAAFRPTKSKPVRRGSGITTTSDEDAPGLARFGAPRTVTAHEFEFGGADDDGPSAIAFVGQRLCVAHEAEVLCFERSTARSKPLALAIGGRDGVTAIAEGPDGLVLAHADKKLVAIDPEAPSKHLALGSTSEETITFILPSPDGSKVAINGKVLEFKKPRALFTLAYGAHAWLDSTRMLRVEKRGAKLDLSSLSAEGETNLGWFRVDDSRFGVVLLVLGERVYVGTNTGVFCVCWTQQRDGNAPLVAHCMWRGAAINSLAFDDTSRTLVAATDSGLVEIDATGASRTLFARPSTAVCVRGDRVGVLCEGRVSRGDEGAKVRAFELTVSSGTRRN
ncbi:MAG: hypothetical protein JNK05_32810 [Myxococcales bacterium]|nr:hypothetical protein [Myxococcales bacterium]